MFEERAQEIDEPPVEYEGDPRHPYHEKWQLELGKAREEQGRLEAAMVDLLRVWFGEDYWRLATAGETFASLRQVLEKHADEMDGLREQVPALVKATRVRNVLSHALMTGNGLLYRRTLDKKVRRRRPTEYVAAENPEYVELFRVSEVAEATELLKSAADAAGQLLYSDGGGKVREFYAAQGEEFDGSSQMRV